MNANTFRMLGALERLGISSQDALALRRISMTLHRWSERECNGEVERDEETGKTYYTYNINGPGPVKRAPTADKERGAQRRLAAIMARYPHLMAYEQGDPRGASLYIIERERLGDKPADAYYSSFGVAVYA